MSSEQTVAKEYPESFDEGAQAASEGKSDLKLNAGDRIRMKFVSGPLTFRENYFELPGAEANEEDKPKKKRIALPFGGQIPGYKLKVKYLCEVLVLDGPMKGQNKLFFFGQQVWDSLQEIKLDYGSIRIPDIVVSRKGSTKDDTRYKAGAVPSTIEAKTIPLKFNLEAEARFSTKEDIDQLPPPPAPGGGSEDSVGGQISEAQLDMIDNLCKQKEVGRGELAKMIERKFKKAVDLSDLTIGQASAVIDLLKNY